jgi:hypothetical protein
MKERIRQSLKLSIIAFLLGSIISNGFLISYIGGQINQPLPLMFLAIACSCLSLPIVIIAVALVIIGLWRWKKGGLITKICFVPTAFIIGAAVGYCAPFFIESPTVTFLRGFDDWVFRNIKTEEIQKLIGDNSDYWPRPEDEQVVFFDSEEEVPEDLPRCFGGFERQYLYLKYSEPDNSKVVEFRWGGVMWHWGVVIGEPNMVMPEAGFEVINEGFVVYRKIIKPGIYVYSDG